MKKLSAPRAASPVPHWSREIGADWGIGSILALAACAVLAFQFWLLPTLTDWASSAAEEGFITYAAQRIRSGEWLYRDFFFPLPAGAPLWQALLQLAGAGSLGERAGGLVASFGSLWLSLSFARAWRLPFPERALLVGLLGAWSFSLWNIPSAPWYAVFLSLLALKIFPRSLSGAGLLFAFSFWFQQSVGLLGAAGAIAWLIHQRQGRGAARFFGMVFAGVFVPFLGIGAFGGLNALSRAVNQIFVFPLFHPAIPGHALAAETFAAPLTSLGLWMLSLFFLRADSKSRSARLVQMGVVAYAGIYVARAPEAFLHAGFILVSLAAWPLSLALALTEQEPDKRFLAWWLPAAGIFLSVFPAFHFSQFLFVFPLSGLLLIYALARVHERYSWLPPIWARFPALAILAGGIYLQAGVVDIRLHGTRDSLGRVSQGREQRLNEEVTAVWRFLTAEGLRPGDPILVLPNAAAVYLGTGFQNPTPHLQFLAGYVEGFGASQSEVLPKFRAAGGRFLVVEERSGLEASVPQIWGEIQAGYREVKSFPEHFTIYAPR
jgi:hypothetical protein